MRKQNCGTSGQVFSLCGSGIEELRVKYFPCAEAELRNFRSNSFLVRKRNCGTSCQVFSLCGNGIVELQVKYFPCAEAELRNFRS